MLTPTPESARAARLDWLFPSPALVYDLPGIELIDQALGDAVRARRPPGPSSTNTATSTAHTTIWGRHRSHSACTSLRISLSPGIVAGFRSRLGAAVQVDVCFVDRIQPETSGKFRYIVSHVPPAIQATT